jgi:2-oxoglutarate ferredoxin oxidoreductase subunit alpha
MTNKTHFSIRIAGPAGLGMHSVMDIIASVFVELGYQIITDSEYQSIIKGGVNYFDVHIHEGSPYITREVDACIALNDKNLVAILGNLKK